MYTQVMKQESVLNNGERRILIQKSFWTQESFERSQEVCNLLKSVSNSACYFVFPIEVYSLTQTLIFNNEGESLKKMILEQGQLNKPASL